MKKDIHPEYHSNATIKCICGNKFTLGSTQKELEVEICANCHPFYTGKKKLIDTAGRVEKFKARLNSARQARQTKSTERKAKNLPSGKQATRRQKTTKNAK